MKIRSSFSISSQNVKMSHEKEFQDSIYTLGFHAWRVLLRSAAHVESMAQRRIIGMVSILGSIELRKGILME